MLEVANTSCFPVTDTNALTPLPCPSSTQYSSKSVIPVIVLSCSVVATPCQEPFIKPSRELMSCWDYQRVVSSEKRSLSLFVFINGFVKRSRCKCMIVTGAAWWAIAPIGWRRDTSVSSLHLTSYVFDVRASILRLCSIRSSKCLYMGSISACSENQGRRRSRRMVRSVDFSCPLRPDTTRATICC